MVYVSNPNRVLKMRRLEAMGIDRKHEAAINKLIPFADKWAWRESIETGVDYGRLFHQEMNRITAEHGLRVL